MLIEMQPDADLADLGRQAQACLSRLLAAAPSAARATVEEAARLVESRMRGAKYHDVPHEAIDLERAVPRLGAMMAASLLSGVKDRCAARNVPASVAAECARQGRRILSSLETAPDAAVSLRNDAFQKDLAICLGESLPCVAQVVERHSGIPRRMLLSTDLRRTARLIALLARQRQLRPYYEIHTHTPMLDGFNKAGWDRCYMLVADLLRADPGCLGIVGASWFYDPAVTEISPRLSYLRDVPASGGAFFLRVGASAKDADLATSTSDTRRKLYEQGKYVPTSYMLVWQREDILNWSARMAPEAASHA